MVAWLHQVLDRFLDEKNFYGRDLIARVLAGIQGGSAFTWALGFVVAPRDIELLAAAATPRDAHVCVGGPVSDGADASALASVRLVHRIEMQPPSMRSTDPVM